MQSVFYGTTRKISRVGASFDFDEWRMARPQLEFGSSPVTFLALYGRILVYSC